MALINNIYVFVQDEKVSHDMDSTTHKTEQGLPLTDTIRRQPTVISLSGKFVNTDNMTASETLSKILQLQSQGSLINYAGRNIANNMQIQSFSTSHPNTNWGGLDFEMELKELRIAKSAYTPKANSNTNKANTNQKIEVDSIVTFLGGAVYNSSDATAPTANRGRSTCRVTQIATYEWSIHQYHLISTDGGKVYGWVDKSNIEATSNDKTAGITESGTQQVSQGDNSAVYYTVQKGDTIWGLVNRNYKDLDTSVQWVIDNNSDAFYIAGDPKQLKIGAKLLMGYR